MSKRIASLLAALTLAVTPSLAGAQWTGLAHGVEYLARTDPGPNRIRALRINLCAAGVRIRATPSDQRGQVTSAWGNASGALAAINGGYGLSGFRPDAGRAAGGGAEWPDSVDTEVRGFFAFGPRNVYHSPAPAVEALPPWAEEAVNGDATLVQGGVAVDCGGCGSGARAPRTALGISADGSTLTMVTVDGRMASSRGMTIDELAILMASFDVDRAMNLDGGGSTTMWVRGQGVVNVPSDGSERTVSNHLGVFATGAGPNRHCRQGYAATYLGSTFPGEGGVRIPIEVGQTVTGSMDFRNDGTETWTGNTRLAPTPRDEDSPLAAPDWISPTRIASPDVDTPTGATGRFTFSLTAPPTPGEYRMTFSAVEEWVTWFGDSWGPADEVFVLTVIATPPGADAGPSALDAGATDTDAAVSTDAGQVARSDASTTPAIDAGPRTPGTPIGGGCAVLAGERPAPAWGAVVALLALCLRRRRAPGVNTRARLARKCMKL